MHSKTHFEWSPSPMLKYVTEVTYENDNDQHELTWINKLGLLVVTDMPALDLN